MTLTFQALGCILYEMVTFSHAFSSTSAIQKGEFAPLPPDLPAEIVQTITSLLQPNPLHRPSVAELLNLPAVRSRLAESPYPVRDAPPQPAHSPRPQPSVPHPQPSVPSPQPAALQHAALRPHAAR